jgi:hypothetical protein
MTIDLLFNSWKKLFQMRKRLPYLFYMYCRRKRERAAVSAFVCLLWGLPWVLWELPRQGSASQAEIILLCVSLVAGGVFSSFIGFILCRIYFDQLQRVSKLESDK